MLEDLPEFVRVRCIIVLRMRRGYVTLPQSKSHFGTNSS